MVSTTTAPINTAFIMAESAHYAPSHPATAAHLLSAGASVGATTAAGGGTPASCGWSVKQSVLSGLDYDGVVPTSVTDLLARGARRNDDIPDFNDDNEVSEEQAIDCYVNDQEYFSALFELRERNRRALQAKLRTMAALRAKIANATFKKRPQDISKGKFQKCTMERKVESEMADIIKACASNSKNGNGYWLSKDSGVYSSPLSTDIEDFSQVTHDADFEMLDTEN